jgi:hypothetical protein
MRSPRWIARAKRPGGTRAPRLCLPRPYSKVSAFDHLEFVVSDAAKGIAAAVVQVANQRRETGPSAPPLEHGLDSVTTAG